MFSEVDMFPCKHCTGNTASETDALLKWDGKERKKGMKEKWLHNITSETLQQCGIDLSEETFDKLWDME